MSLRNTTKRTWAARATAAAAVAGVAVLGAPSAHAGTSTIITITSLSTHRVAATTANQVITVTGTGFDEASIASVKINGCTTDPTYIVASATSLLLKTSADCATSSTGVITLTDSSANTVVTTPATNTKEVLVFVAPPTLAAPTATVRPVVTDNTAGIAYADQVTSGSTNGGTVIRVYAGGTPFVNSTTYPLSATLDGVKLTGVSMPSGGAYFTGTLGAVAADAAPILKITSNGVSASFKYGAGGAGGTAGTHDFTISGTTISVTPAFGPLKGGTTLAVSGKAFTSSTTVTVGGNSCVKVTQTTTKFTCTVPAAGSGKTAGPVEVVATTGTVSSVVSAGSTFTYVGE